MLKLLHAFIISVILFSCAIGNRKPITSDNIADCGGALPILQSGTSRTELPGTSGNKDEFREYLALKDLEVGNSVWFSFIAEYDGKFNLKAETESGDLNLVVFQTDGKDICGDIESGRAEIKRMLVREESPTVWLINRNIKNGLSALPMRKGDKIHFVIFTRKNRKTKISLDVNLVPNKVDQIVMASDNKKKIVDLTKDKIGNVTTIELRDAETGDPVIAFIHLHGIKELEITEKASDLLFHPNRSGLMLIECSVEGYFFVDRKEEVSFNNDKKIEIKLQQLKKGKSAQLEDISFKPGTSEFLPSAEPVLLRLREFMGLNSKINIEIQGHVYEPNETTAGGQKMSEARAKQVKKYLVNGGINEKRMEAVGYGASKPIYPNPQRNEEEQANRRVEIVIL
jgi:outer membrane protein OmpA-like peptidoglycan-associated protein